MIQTAALLWEGKLKLGSLMINNNNNNKGRKRKKKKVYLISQIITPLLYKLVPIRFYEAINSTPTILFYLTLIGTINVDWYL